MENNNNEGNMLRSGRSVLSTPLIKSRTSRSLNEGADLPHKSFPSNLDVVEYYQHLRSLKGRNVSQKVIELAVARDLQDLYENNGFETEPLKYLKGC